MIFACFFKALSQISDPRFRKVLMLGIGLTLVLLIAATAAFLMLIQWLAGDTTEVWLIGEVQWLDDLLGWTGFLAMFVLSIFLMVPVASAITSMFLDEVAQAVEDRHYPNLPPATRVSLWDATRDTVNFLGVLVGANLLALVLYAFVPPLMLFIFWGMNGYLLGHEYFQLAAMRRVGRTKARELRKANRGTIWLAGILMAVPLSIPLVNLLIPILGAATFTHVFHGLKNRTA
ncbi:EI24 domain-containing protein [Roseovarius phycicola]|uniref:EI24 domain-containing protein n=1 Tax=Roseovarius phycicola TaxID=3080976 RepID=A0ABZ2HLG3_9RHOB